MGGAMPTRLLPRGSVGYGYWVARVWLAFAGSFALFAMASSYLIIPELYYDHQPVPPLAGRLPGIAVGSGIGLLMIVPTRWTSQGWKWRARMAVSSVVGLALTGIGVAMIANGLRGGYDPAIIPAGAGVLLTGVCLPWCLWRRSTADPLCPPLPGGSDGL